jgi:molybdate/tungstate transport system permease protein
VKTRDQTAIWAARLFGAILIVFLAAPVAMLVLTGAGGASTRLAHDATLQDSLILTALTATAATLIGVVGGTPVAYLLARYRFHGRAVLAAILDLPLLIPHPVAGIAILLFLSRGNPVGESLMQMGLRIVGTPFGIVAGMLFVSAPLFVSAAREAFVKVDPQFELVARTLGATRVHMFRRITLPLAARGLMSAAVVMWSRAVSEFGAVVVLAYNPKVISILSYDRFTSYGLREVLPVAAAVVLLSFVPLIILRALRYEKEIEVI